MFRALAHPARRKIVEAALGQDRSFVELREMVNRSEAALAGHLRILREAKILAVTRVGGSMTYRANRKAMRSASKWLGSMAGTVSGSRSASAR